MDQPAWSSIRRLTARAANMIVRPASMELRLRWQMGRARMSLPGIRNDFPGLEQLVAGAGHEPGRDRGAAGSGGKRTWSLLSP
jgi:hypothetical protein